MFKAHFVDTKLRQQVEIIFPQTTFNVQIDQNGVKTQASFGVCVEKLASANVLQLRLIDRNNQSSMLLSTIDVSAFETLKTEQLLHVTFTGFVDQLLQILENCRQGELHMSLSPSPLPHFKQLQFYEQRSFRNLVHLYLPVEEAPVNFVMFHLSQTIAHLQQKCAAEKSQSEHSQAQIASRDNSIRDLKHQISQLQSDLIDQDRALAAQSAAEAKKIQQLKESHHQEESRLKDVAKKLQCRIEALSKENFDLNESVLTEARKCDVLRNDLVLMKAACATLRDKNEKLLSEQENHSKELKKSELQYEDSRKQFHSLQDLLKQLEKQKSDLKAELEAEKQICHSKRNALHVATEDIAKANEIILKKLKENALLIEHTDYLNKLLQKEKSERKIRDEKIKMLENNAASANNILQQKKDVENSLDELRNTADLIENKYSKQINDLKLRLLSIVEGSPANRTNLLRPRNTIEY